MKPKVLSLDQLASHSAELRARGQRLVATNGCFDILHVGHVRYLTSARAFGDALAVGVNSDASVEIIKGKGRPINSEADRAELLAALECVDFVTVFAESRATKFLQSAAPVTYVKGGDYKPETLDPEERHVLESIGAEIRIISFQAGYSTTLMVDRIKSN